MFFILILICQNLELVSSINLQMREYSVKVSEGKSESVEYFYLLSNSTLLELKSESFSFGV